MRVTRYFFQVDSQILEVKENLTNTKNTILLTHNGDKGGQGNRKKRKHSNIIIGPHKELMVSKEIKVSKKLKRQSFQNTKKLHAHKTNYCGNI